MVIILDDAVKPGVVASHYVADPLAPEFLTQYFPHTDFARADKYKSHYQSRYQYKKILISL